MTSGKAHELSNNGLIAAYIRRRARRYFGRIEDIEDAEAEAWAKISEAPDNLTDTEYMTVARKAISALYMRNWRRRKQLSRGKA